MRLAACRGSEAGLPERVPGHVATLRHSPPLPQIGVVALAPWHLARATVPECHGDRVSLKISD